MDVVFLIATRPDAPKGAGSGPLGEGTLAERCDPTAVAREAGTEAVPIRKVECAG